MDLEIRLLLVSVVAMSIFRPRIVLSLANSEEIFPEAEGPTAAETSDELWFRSGPPPRVFDVDDYGAEANGCNDTEVKLAKSRTSSTHPLGIARCCRFSCGARRFLCNGCSELMIASASISGVSCGVERGMQLLRLPVRVPRARGEDLPPDARELPWPLQSYLHHCNGDLSLLLTISMYSSALSVLGCSLLHCKWWSDKGDAGGSVEPIGLAGLWPARLDHVRGHRSPPCSRRRDAQWERTAVVDQLVQIQHINGNFFWLSISFHEKKVVFIWTWPDAHFQVLTWQSFLCIFFISIHQPCVTGPTVPLHPCFAPEVVCISDVFQLVTCSLAGAVL
jgi:hypothetical protein